ncbi:MAG: Rrf2 family transcriptional regulator [Flavobacteriaceae bacterium]|nr:Rrf2 family transcriptional regulator [Flavobacteriaceae bacterium]
MLSKSSAYAIRAVLYLSLYSNEERKCSPKEIADIINIPAPFLAKILQVLAKNRLISSTKGRNGGFYLTEKNRLNSLISIVDCIDGLDKFQECLLGLPICSNVYPCPIHHAISPIRKKLIEELTFKTIDDLTQEIKDGNTYISL